MSSNTDTPHAVDLDDVDRRILAVLASDGRASYTTIATNVGLSVSAAHERVRKLQDRGVITGYTALIDHAATGHTVSAFVTVVGAPAVQFRSFGGVELLSENVAALDLDGINGVAAVHQVADPAGDGYLIHIHAENLAALNATLAAIRDRTGAVTRTAIVLPE
jgi:Lrp/AsnC family leucine-responsive transcriptional regulator